MPAASLTAKLPPSPESTELPPFPDRPAPPTPPDRREPPPPPDHHAPPARPHHHAPATPSDRHAPPAPPDHHAPPTPPGHHEPATSLDRDPVQEALRSVERVAATWAAQDAELDAEIAALEAVGVLTAPAEEERPGLDFDPDSVPPHGLHPWLADLSAPSFDECLAATADATGPKMSQAGRRDRDRGGAPGFAAGEPADLLSPGAALAGFAEDARAAGLSRLTDDELAGVIRAGRRLSSWASALELAAVSDLMRRREQQEADGNPHAAEHTDAEIAALLTLTGRGAGRVLDLAVALRRLPLTARALEAGVIDLPRVGVIAEETTGLDDDHAAAVEQHVLDRAPGQTTSQVRAAARRAVLAADPRAARKRQEQAQREARVERWDEHAGTAALAGRDLPPAAVIAADQHLSALARGLRAAGLAGTADQLRAQAFLALLSGTPAAALLPTGQQQSGSAASGSGTSADTPAESGLPGQPSMRGNPDMAGNRGRAGNPNMAGSPVTHGSPGAPAPSTSATADWPGTPASAGWPGIPAGTGRPGIPAGADSSGTPASADWPGIPAGTGRPGIPAGADSSGTPTSAGWPGIPAGADSSGIATSAGWPGIPAGADSSGTPTSAGWPRIPAMAGTVNLTMPLTTWLGFRDAPGEVTGFGPLTADDSRHLGAAMAGHPQTRWCVTLTGEDGRPVAHGCARPGHGPPPPAHGPAPSGRGPAPSAHGPAPSAHGPAPSGRGPAPSAHGPAPSAHGPAPSAHGPAPSAHAGESPVHGPAPPDHGPAPPDHGPAPPDRGHMAPDHGPGPAVHGHGPADHGTGPAAWLASIPMEWFEPAGCAHQRRSPAYRPPPTLQHLIRVRQQTCAFPGCRRPASQCDLDHTTPFQRGGLTCECNLAPLCRSHHGAKQARGWHLVQDQPGQMTWRLPSGRSYATCAEPYPM